MYIFGLAWGSLRIGSKQQASFCLQAQIIFWQSTVNPCSKSEIQANIEYLQFAKERYEEENRQQPSALSKLRI